MKKIVVASILVSLIIASCSNFMEPANISDNREQAGGTAKSSIDVKIFVPDYQKLAEQGRAIAPQTAKVRLSVANGMNVHVQHGDLLTLNPASIEPVPGSPSGLPGGTWSGKFTALACKTYAPGSLKIELLDQNNKVITQGVNQAAVEVVPDQAAQAVFFTSPEQFSSVSGSLASGEMRFWMVRMMGGYSYKLTLSAEGSWPDIVVFNADGTFREYCSVSNSSGSEIMFNPAADDDCYLGIWADAGAVRAYSVALSYKFNAAHEDFSGGFNGWTAGSSGSGATPPVIVVENGKSILEFASQAMFMNGRAILSRTFNLTEPASLSFSVKTDIAGSQAGANTFFKLYVDGAEKASYAGLGAPWKTGSVVIPAGTHEIKFVLEKDSSTSFSAPRTNKVWLADISILPDVTAYLDIYPKGPKDTYAGGFPIQYTAQALRSDGSIRSGLSGIVYSGPGVNPATGLFTPPATAGTYTVTASLGGKTVRSDTITVHPADYLRRPWTNPVTGKTYNGYQGASGEIKQGQLTFTCPAEEIISADGFVTLEGKLGINDYLPQTLYLEKTGDSSLRTSYNIEYGKDFRIRVWLRFGPGQYRITTSYGTEIFTITNTCTDTGVGGDPRFLYPSSVVQSDDFRITNLLSELLYGVSGEAEKIKIIHDYLVQNTVYDMASTAAGGGNRKPQDALSVLGKRYHFDLQYEPAGHFFAVCEGYANAAAALLRALGIETQYVSSTPMNHAWNQVYTGGSWKFLDVTWDDPVYSATGLDLGPDAVQYTYYLLSSLNGLPDPKNPGYNDHLGGIVDQTRGIATVPFIPKMPGMPDGWY